MKTLLILLHILLCQWVVTFGNEHGNIGIKNVGNADGKVLLTLASDKLPLSLETVRSMVDNTDIKFVRLTPLDETHLKICSSFGDNTYLTVKTLCDNKRSVDSVLFITGKPLVIKINFWSGFGLPETGHSYQSESKYEKQPLHAAKIAKN